VPYSWWGQNWVPDSATPAFSWKGHAAQVLLELSVAGWCPLGNARNFESRKAGSSLIAGISQKKCLRDTHHYPSASRSQPHSPLIIDFT